MIIEALIEQLRRNWGWFALRGAAAIAFGVLAFMWPGLTLVVLTMLWGAYALADGVAALIGAFRIKDGDRPGWPLALLGLLGIAAGLTTLLWPGMTAALLLMLIAAWAITIGVLQIIAAIWIRKAIDNEWLLIGSGALSVCFGLLMLSSPGGGAVAVAWTIAAYSVLFGVLLVAVGFRLRKLEPSRPASARRVGA